MVATRAAQGIGSGRRYTHMTSNLVRYRDATDDPDQRVDYPSVVAEFTALGFVQVGRIVAEPIDGTYEDLAESFPPEQRELFLEHATVPTPLLTPPDRSAWVEVSWFWGSPSVRIRSELSDGSLVETNRRWRHQPAVPSELARYWRHTNIDRDMAKGSVPSRGRSIVISDAADGEEQWREHRRHVEAYAAKRGAGVVTTTTVDRCVEINERAFAHDVATERKTVGFWKPIVLAYGAVALLIVGAVVLAGNIVLAIALCLVFAALSLIVPGLVISTVRSLPQSIRPPYV